MKPRAEFLILTIAAAAVTIVGTQFNIYHYLGLYLTLTSGPTAAKIGLASISTFAGALAWVKSVGYFVMFLAMVVEGPIVASAAAFAAALGYFNIFAVFGLAILGDLVGDFIYYGIGYYGRVAFVEKYGSKVGLTKQRMKHIEKLLKNHPKKTMAAIKLAPILPAPGLMMIGATRMPLKRYTWMTLIVTLPKALTFILLGYYFGSAYDAIARYFQNGEYFIIAAVAITLAVYYGYGKLSALVSTRLEPI